MVTSGDNCPTTKDSRLRTSSRNSALTNQSKSQFIFLSRADRVFSSKLVKHAAARVIAAIASIEISHNTWPQLLPFLNQACHAPDASQREVGVYILYVVLENSYEHLHKHIGAIMKLFEQTVNDPESIDVRVNSVRALGTIAQYIDRDEHVEVVSQMLIIRVFGAHGRYSDTSKLFFPP